MVYLKESAREYWLIAVLMGLVIAGVFGLAGGTLSQLFNLIGDRINTMAPR